MTKADMMLKEAKEMMNYRVKLEKVILYGLDEEVMVNMEQDTFVDEETGYEIYVTEDGRWIAEDDAIGEWVQIRA